MPLPVTLDVRNFASSSSDGYSNTTASNGQIYSYKYSGGSDGAGNVQEKTGSGLQEITVTLTSDSRYVISDVTFSDDPGAQMSWHSISATQACIDDADVLDENAYYAVQIRDNSAQCTLICDPRIKNEP